MNEWFSSLGHGKALTQHLKWASIKCNKCNIPLKLVKEDECISVKECPRCGYRGALIKKIKKEE